MTRSPGINIADVDEQVTCRDTVLFRGELLEYGCDFEGAVEVRLAYETGETHWECPQCHFDHIGLIRDS